MHLFLNFFKSESSDTPLLDFPCEGVSQGWPGNPTSSWLRSCSPQSVVPSAVYSTSGSDYTSMAPQITIQLFLASCLSGFCPSALNSHLIQLTSLQDYFKGDILKVNLRSPPYLYRTTWFCHRESFHFGDESWC